MAGGEAGNGMGLNARVRTQDGWAVRDAVVAVTDAAGAQVLRAEADADDGVRTDTALPVGACTVIVTAPGHAPHASTALVTASGRAGVGTWCPPGRAAPNRRRRGVSPGGIPPPSAAGPPSPRAPGPPAAGGAAHLFASSPGLIRYPAPRRVWIIGERPASILRRR